MLFIGSSRSSHFFSVCLSCSHQICLADCAWITFKYLSIMDIIAIGCRFMYMPAFVFVYLLMYVCRWHSPFVSMVHTQQLDRAPIIAMYVHWKQTTRSLDWVKKCATFTCWSHSIPISFICSLRYGFFSLFFCCCYSFLFLTCSFTFALRVCCLFCSTAAAATTAITIIVAVVDISNRLCTLNRLCALRTNVKIIQKKHR